ncbi:MULTISPECIES: hypothetical protein [unclassified Sinorhizobium]|uniref:hypothetical protein n=1 Tax=unclassified Sinorhizobium TaxID=2613772 RepID=UPI003524CE2B
MEKYREIGGFSFDDILSSDPIEVSLPDADIIPLVYHGSARQTVLDSAAVALRLADLIDFKSARLRFESRAALCQHFKIPLTASIILTGVNHDHRVEPWWTLGARRLDILGALKRLDIELITTPNFSLVADNPRTDGLHSMKRIAISFAEIQNTGIACALHPNGSTWRDFDRWAAFVRGHGEIGVIAYEFETGSAHNHRKKAHVEGLCRVAGLAGRPLDIVVRGAPDVIPELRRHFRRVVYIETSGFLKTMMRKKAIRATNSRLTWQPVVTVKSEPICSLYEHNNREQADYLRATYYG